MRPENLKDFVSCNKEFIINLITITEFDSKLKVKDINYTRQRNTVEAYKCDSLGPDQK